MLNSFIVRRERKIATSYTQTNKRHVQALSKKK